MEKTNWKEIIKEKKEEIIDIFTDYEKKSYYTNSYFQIELFENGEIKVSEHAGQNSWTEYDENSITLKFINPKTNYFKNECINDRINLYIQVMTKEEKEKFLIIDDIYETEIMVELNKKIYQKAYDLFVEICIDYYKPEEDLKQIIEKF